MTADSRGNVEVEGSQVMLPSSLMQQITSEDSALERREMNDNMFQWTCIHHSFIILFLLLVLVAMLATILCIFYYYRDIFFMTTTSLRSPDHFHCLPTTVSNISNKSSYSSWLCYYGNQCYYVTDDRIIKPAYLRHPLSELHCLPWLMHCVLLWFLVLTLTCFFVLIPVLPAFG